MLTNGDFEDVADLLEPNGYLDGGWEAWQDPPHQDLGTCSIVVDPATSPQGQAFARCIVNDVQGPADWEFQLQQGGFPISNDAHYTLSFRIRASAPRPVHVAVQAAFSGKPYGLSNVISAGMQWDLVTIPFTGCCVDPGSVDPNSKVGIWLRSVPGTLEIDDVRLVEEP